MPSRSSSLTRWNSSVPAISASPQPSRSTTQSRDGTDGAARKFARLHHPVLKDQAHTRLPQLPDGGGTACSAACGSPSSTRIYQHQTAPQIIEAILRRHDLVRGISSPSSCAASIPQHAFRFQYQMSDWAYIRLLMEQEGLYSYFVPGKFGEMVVFGDDIDHYLYKPELRVPYRETGWARGRAWRRCLALQYKCADRARVVPCGGLQSRAGVGAHSTARPTSRERTTTDLRAVRMSSALITWISRAPSGRRNFVTKP